MRVRILSILGLTIIPGLTVAQTPDAAAAREVSTAFFKAIEAADWRAAAGFLDLTVLERERQSAVEGARSQRTIPPMTVERLMRMDPQMPRAVAEYQVKRMNTARASMNFLEHDFGVGDPDSLLALPIEVAAARWLEAHDERAMYREARRYSKSCPVAPSDSGPAPEYHIIGTVVDDSIAYTLFRQGYRDMPAEPPSPPKVLQLRRDRGGWWVVPGSDISGVMGLAVSCETITPKKPGGA